MSDILTRRQTHFVLWCPADTGNPPVLIIGQIKNGNPPTFQPLGHLSSLKLKPVKGVQALWELDATAVGLTDGSTYHYWLEVDDSLRPGKRVQITDPLAYAVDYRLYAPANPSTEHPASVIGWSGGKLVAHDPNGEKCEPKVAPFDKLAANTRMVIYELPTAWVRTIGSDGFERAVGTLRDIRALVDKGVVGANFPDLSVTDKDNQYLVRLGINALEMLPPADSIYARQWGYGTSHYFAPDYELGYPEGHLSPTSNQDLTLLINSCHEHGIRVFLDVVMGFMKDEPYRHIDFDDFYLENPNMHPDDPDAYNSRNGGGDEFRNPYGGSCPRYVRTKTTYDPVSGGVKEISPARQHMLTFLTRWMQDFQIDGIRLDSVENVANWDFIRDFKNAAHTHFRQRYLSEGPSADAKFLVVGEELTMPSGLITQGCLDGLWNESFQSFIRAAILGEGFQELSFEQTVRCAINCTRNVNGIIDPRFGDGTKAINYLTSHDVQGKRKERLYNLMRATLTLESSAMLFNRSEIEGKVREELKAQGRDPFSNNCEKEVQDRVNETILHKARLRRIKLGFTCLLTAVGTPMILAGEEFGDQHDLFDSCGNVTHEGGKQIDPVNFSRVDEPDRRELFDYVARLVKLRTSHEALSVDETAFIHQDLSEGKRVFVWKRGSDENPVVVVANFSEFVTSLAPGPNAEYIVPNWPPTPTGHHWYEVTQSRPIVNGRPDKEPVFSWEAKVFCLVPDNNP